MKGLYKGLHLFLGILIGAWITVLFVKADFDSTIVGLGEAGNANWDNLRVELIDTISLIMLGLSLFSVIYLLVVGIAFLKTIKK